MRRAARAALGLIERAGLIRREILPGQRSYTTSLTKGADEKILRSFFDGLAEKHARDKEKLNALLRYVDHRGCRHAFLLDYFGETDGGRMSSSAAARGDTRPPMVPNCHACDHCAPCVAVMRVAPDETQWVILQKILSCVARMKGGFGGHRVAQVLRGEKDPVVISKGLDQLSTFGLLPKMPIPQIRALLDALVAEGCVAPSPEPYNTLSITPKGVDVAKRAFPNFQIAWPPVETETPAKPKVFKRKK
ncbi:MAG: RecQ family zinc-binding domain-containing protein [Kiritimatiellaeota bacterium]|nr:RecQ family zinc-binding domain-containing protein [Kiritimatiellota bacterium]